MPSTNRSRANSNLSLRDGRPLKAEPELTPSARKKISMLPDLRRQQLLGQQVSSTELSEQQQDQAETATQSSDQVADLSKAAFDTPQIAKPTKSTRYTISSRTAAPMAATSSLQTRDTLKMPEEGPPAINHHRKPSYVVNVTDFGLHHGGTATTRPPNVGDDLLSRLEGLRQFRGWSARIHDAADQQVDSVSKKGSYHSSTVIDSVHPTGREVPVGVKACSARVEHSLPLRHDSELLERNIDAPTPFSSPMVTPVPSTTIQAQRTRQPSVSLPDLDLSAVSSQDAMKYARSVDHSRTVTISSESPSVQLAPKSRSASRKRPDTEVPRRANSKSRSHPPISFPKDFYERFPHVEETSAHTQEQQSNSGAKPSPGVSPNTIPARPEENQMVPEDIQPLATPHDKRGRPSFYTTIHYFTGCLHASPPANRPLDPKAQPRPDPDFYSSHGTTIRSIIPGACFNCDVDNRRHREDKILNTSTAQLHQLTSELAKALDGLELDESDDEEAGSLHDRFSARLLTPSNFAEDKYDLDIETRGASELPPLSDDPEITNALRSGKLQTVEQRFYLERVTKEIRDLEAEIDHLRDEQDEQIRKVWLGFTPRWGPATLGVQRGRQVTKRRQAESATSESMRSQHLHSAAADDFDADAIQVVTADFGGRDFGGSSVSNGTSRDRSRSSRSRSDTRTPTSTSSVSIRDAPGSRTPGEGKMRVGWIREEKY